MNKILFIAVPIILLGLILYFFLRPIICPSKENSISVVIFNYTYLENDNYRDNLIKEISKLYFENSSENLQIKLYFKTGQMKSLTIAPPGDFATDSAKEQNINSKIINEIKAGNSINAVDANTQVQTLLQNIISFDEDNINNIFLFGSFPSGYTKENAQQAIKDINEKMKGPNLKKTKIYWMLKSCSVEPEQEILKRLEKTNILVNKEVTVSPRTTASVTPPPSFGTLNLDLVFMSSLDVQKKNKVIQILKANISKFRNTQFTYYSSLGKNSELVNYKDYPAFVTKLDNMINQVKPNDWHNSKFLLKAVFEKYESFKDTANVFLLGDQKDYKQELIFRLDKFKKNDNITFYFSLLPEQLESTLNNVMTTKVKTSIIK